MNQIEAKRKQIQYLSYVFAIIILLYFGNKIGVKGLVYFMLGLESVCLLSIFNGECFADAYGRFIRFKRAKGQYKTNQIMKSKLLILQCISGFVLSVVLCIASPYICRYGFNVPLAEFAMRILSFVIFFRSVSSVFLGYFQGNSSHLPTAANSILRQVLFFLFGNVFCNMLYEYGDKVSGILRNEEFSAMYGVIGLSVGYLVTEIILLVFNIIIYFNSDKDYDFKRSLEGYQKSDSLQRVTNLLFKYMKWGAGGILLTKIPFWFSLFLYFNAVEGPVDRVQAFGEFYHDFLLIGGALALLCVSRITNSSSKLFYAKRNSDTKYIRDTGSVSIHFSYIFGLFWLVAFLGLGRVLKSIFTMPNLYMLGLIVLGVCVSYSALTLIRILQDVRRIMIFLIIFASFWCGCVLGGQYLFKNEIIFMIYSLLGGLVILAISSVSYISSAGRLRYDFIKIYVTPFIVAAVSGFAMYLVDYVIHPHMTIFASLTISLVVGYFLYVVLLIVGQSVNEKEISYLYGKTMRKILLPLFRI